MIPNDTFTGRAPVTLEYRRDVGRAPVQWMLGVFHDQVYDFHYMTSIPHFLVREAELFVENSSVFEKNGSIRVSTRSGILFV